MTISTRSARSIRRGITAGRGFIRCISTGNRGYPDDDDEGIDVMDPLTYRAYMRTLDRYTYRPRSRFKK